MCLNPDWFDKHSERTDRWHRESVTEEEARARLDMRFSTVYPIAQEMADWLLQNWTKAQISDLGDSYRDYVLGRKQ